MVEGMQKHNIGKLIKIHFDFTEGNVDWEILEYPASFLLVY